MLIACFLPVLVAAAVALADSLATSSDYVLPLYAW
jgi:hypothetical protein